MDAGYFLTKFDNELRLKVVANIWQGNVLTVSTTFWGLVYKLLPEYGLYPDANVSQLSNKLKNQNLIKEGTTGFVLTERGQIAQKKYWQTHYQPTALAINISYDLRAFKSLFLLANQAISELAYQNRQFYPYQVEAKQQWQVKQWLKRYQRATLITKWQQALTDWLMTLVKEDADNFVATLFAHQMPGQLLTELAQPSTWTLFDKQQWQLDMFAKLLTFSLENQTIISQLAQLSERSLIAESTKLTLDLWQQGLSIEGISQARQLKVTTIREHLLQGVMLKNWSVAAIKQLIPQAEQVRLASVFSKPADFLNWQFEDYGRANQPALFTYFRLWQLCALKAGGQHD